MTTHYETLSVSPDAPPEVISAAYRALSKALHPDRPGGDAEKFALVNAANDVLRHVDSRAAYDATLAQAAAPETETEPEFDETPWGEEVDLEEVIDAPVVPVSTPTAFEPALFESADPFPVWAVRSGAGRTWLLGLLVSIALAALASQIMRDRAAPLVKLPEVNAGSIFALLVLGAGILTVLIGARAHGTCLFVSTGTIWFWGQGGWNPDARWTWTMTCLVLSLIAALASSTAFRSRP